MPKRGQKTAQGKAVVRLNPVRHGILSLTPVIPLLEPEEEWQAHRAAILASLAPEGHLEKMLAARVALLLWRLQRLALYEREAILNAQDLIGEDLALSARHSHEIFPTKPTSEIVEKIDRMLAARLLPGEYTLNKITRYEAHLNRQLYQAMHELEALQARCQGHATPLAIIDLQAIPETWVATRRPALIGAEGSASRRTLERRQVALQFVVGDLAAVV